jgi:hypothetical protein
MKPTEIRVELAVHKQILVEIQADVKEHIRRTAAVEARTAKLEQFQWMVLGAGALITIVSTLVGIYVSVSP